MCFYYFAWWQISLFLSDNIQLWIFRSTLAAQIWSPPRPLFWAQLRLSETQSDIFILKACLFSDSDNHQSDQTSNNNKIINVDHDIMKRARCVFINFEFLIKLLVRFAELLAAAEKSKHLENREFEINPRLEAWFRKWETLCIHLMLLPPAHQFLVYL